MVIAKEIDQMKRYKLVGMKRAPTQNLLLKTFLDPGSYIVYVRNTNLLILRLRLLGPTAKQALLHFPALAKLRSLSRPPSAPQNP